MRLYIIKSLLLIAVFMPLKTWANFNKLPNTTDIELLAKQAIIIDAHTGKVLLEKNADQRMTPSSMSKMMTSYLIESKIIKGEASPDTMLTVSEKAWRMGGSKMFVPLGAKVSLIDLLRGIIIQSGNDACIVAAEGLFGSERMFVSEMNEVAKKMGLKSTQFANASGWPEEGHYSTARDLAILGSHVVKDHPEFYKIYKETNFTFGNISQGNRNTLLYNKDYNCDGIKTGHTEDGGFGVVVSFLDGEQRYIMVINGLSSMKARADEAVKVVNWTKENFISKPLFKKDEVIEKAVPIKFGKKDHISLLAAKDLNLLLPRLEQNKISTKTHFSTPLPAPIKKGDVLGKVVIKTPSLEEELALLAAEDVEELSFLGRMKQSIFDFVKSKIF